MERDKIEKIARIICENKVGDCLCPEPQNIACTAHCKAVEVLKAILPEGAVVLTKEEIKSGITYYDVVKDIIRKETAREILNDIFSDTYTIGGGLYELTPKDKKMLYKKFGVEVEE